MPEQSTRGKISEFAAAVLAYADILAGGRSASLLISEYDALDAEVRRLLEDFERKLDAIKAEES